MKRLRYWVKYWGCALIFGPGFFAGLIVAILIEGYKFGREEATEILNEQIEEQEQP